MFCPSPPICPAPRHDRLPKDLTLTLVAGYRADIRLKIIRRWMDLEEAQAALPQRRLPQNYGEALRALADESDGVVQVTAERDEARDEVEALRPEAEAWPC